MKIAIIGAGLAGLTAATQLATAGHRVDLLEKSRGLGGRMSTRRETWANLDLGAQYFTARSVEFREQVGRWIRVGQVARWDFDPLRAGDHGLQASPDATRRYVGLPQMNAPLRGSDRGDMGFFAETRIVGLERREGGWRLRDAVSERPAIYDWVISSLPAEQGRDLLRETGLDASIPAAMHAPCWAVGLGTRGRVDPEIQGIFGDDVVSWAARQSSKPGRVAPPDCDDSWVLHLSPQWSREHGKETARDPAEVAAQWLQARLGTTLQVRHVYRHYWRYARLAGQGLEDPCLVDPDRKLAAIGAWCLGGKVEDAFLSGLALARRLRSESAASRATPVLPAEDPRR